MDEDGALGLQGIRVGGGLFLAKLFQKSPYNICHFILKSPPITIELVC